MKQTNNAIKFLMAQYRAIFKHAYLKGLVSAAVLTAGLAAGVTATAANTGTALTSLDGLSGASGIITITAEGGTGDTDSTYNTLAISGGAAGTPDGELKTINILGSTSDAEKLIIYGSGNLDTSAIEWNIKDTVVGLTIVNSDDDTGASAETASALNFKAKTIDVNANSNYARLNVTGKEPTTGAGSTTVQATTLNIGTTGSGSVTITGVDSGTATLSGSEINIGAGGLITLDGATSGTAILSGSLVSGSTGTIRVADSKYGNINVYTNAAENVGVTFDISGSGVIDLYQDSQAQNLNLNAGGIVVGDEGSLTITSGSTTLSGSAELTLGTDATLNISGSGGELNLGSATITAGEGSQLNIQANAELTVNGGDSLNNALKTLNLNVSGSSAPAATATATISGSLTTKLSKAGEAGLTVGTSGTVTVTDTLTIQDVADGSTTATSEITAKNLSFTGKNAEYNVKAGTFTVSGGSLTGDAAVVLSTSNAKLNFSGTSSIDNDLVIGKDSESIVSGQTKVTSGVTVTIGDEEGDGSLFISGSDAGLTFDSSTLKMVSGSVIVSGSAATTLDLRSGSLTYEGTNAAKILVDEQGVLHVDGEQLTAALTKENSKFGLIVSGSAGSPTNYSTANVYGNLITRLVAVGDLNTKSGIVVGASGSLVVDGDLTVNTSGSNDVTIGAAGKISSNDLNFSGGSDYAITSGDFTVKGNLNSDAKLTFKESDIHISSDTKSDITGEIALESDASAEITNTPATLSGSLTIGDTDASSGSLTISATTTDGASLTLTSGSSLDIKSGSVTVSGSNALLDLTQGSLKTNADNEAIITVNNNATLNVNSADISGAVTGAGFKLALTNNATANSVGDLTISDDKFVSAGDEGIIVDSGSKFDVNGTLTINPSSENIDLTGLAGTVSADSLSLAAAKVSGGGIGTTLVAKSGLEASSALTIDQLTLNLGENSGSVGSINADLVVGDTDTTNMNVLGSWTSSKKLTVSEFGNVVIGDSTNTSALKVNALDASAGKLTVNQNATFTANSITGGKNINVAGNMTINGKADTIEKGHEGEDGNFGFALSGSTINVTGGRFTIGNAALAGLINEDFEVGENVTEITSGHGFVYDNFGTYNLTKNGVLSLQFASGDSITVAELKQLKFELAGADKDGIITGGILDLGAGTVAEIQEVIQSGSVSWENYQGVIKDSNVVYDDLVDVKVTGVDSAFTGAIGSVQLSSSDSNASLTVDGNANLIGADANGNFVSNSLSGTAGISATAGSNIALWGNGNVNTVTLAAGEEGEETTLSLVQGYGAKDGDSFEVTVAGVNAVDADGVTIADNTKVQIAESVSVNFTNNVTVDTLTAAGTVNATGQSIKTNTAETAEGVEITAKDFSALEYANLNGNVKVTNNMTLKADQSSAQEGEVIKAVVAGTVEVGNKLDASYVAFGKDVVATNALTASDSTFAGKVTTAALEATGSEFADNVTASTSFNATNSNFAGSVETKSLTATGSDFGHDVVAETLNATSVTFAADHVVKTQTATFKGQDNKINSAFAAEKGVVFGDGTNASETTVTNLFSANNIEFTATTTAGATTELNVLDGVVVANSLTGSNGVTINVGSDDVDNDATGTLEINGSMDLAGATLKVDPSYEKKTATAAVKSLSGATRGNLGTLTGNVFVGKNSAVGVGVNTAGLNSLIAQFQNNGSFVDPVADDGEYGAMFYLDKPVTIGTGYGITLTAGTEDELPTTLGSVSDAIYLGEATALAVNINNVNSNGGAYITFTPNTNSSTSALVEEDTGDGGEGTDPAPTANKGSVLADGGDIVLYGDNYQKSYQLFEDGVKIQDLAGNDTTITVVSANGLLVGELDTDSLGSVDMGLNKDKASVFLANASAPVQATVLEYLGFNETTETPADPEPPVDGGAEGETGTGTEGDADATPAVKAVASVDTTANEQNYFLSRMVLGGTAGDAETVARLGVYGGAAQAALVAGSSTTDAVASRMGMGAQTGAVTFADNGQGAGLWGAPIYKNHDSDGFGVQGLSYGADLDITGLALGGDITMANGVRVGAAFNVGSGDSDGQGAAAGVSNDFDYYGFSIYGGYTMGNINIVGDISYTVVDNDVTGNTAIEKVSANMDSTNFSLGVTGSYAMDLNGLSVVPHAGLRFTQIDMDDYTVKGSADIAKYSADSANTFSIPVGVTFAKEINAGSWTVKPALDLTLTANMGDDSVDGTVAWADMTNLTTKLESEVVDSFTYGATLGVAAKSGNLSLGLGVNYTGASSADEYGVSANARFVF